MMFSTPGAQKVRAANEEAAHDAFLRVGSTSILQRSSDQSKTAIVKTFPNAIPCLICDVIPNRREAAVRSLLSACQQQVPRRAFGPTRNDIQTDHT
jgi:hypothetical protein